MSKSIWKCFSLRRLTAASALVCSLLACVQAFACCSLEPAHFTSTLGWAGEAHKNGKLIHLLGYENTVKNLALANGKPVGNAMFLPIPAQPGTMTEANILDTSEVPRFLHDMQDALPKAPPPEPGMEVMSASGIPQVQVFEHGIYTIVLANNPRDIPAALARVPARKRPKINQAIFSAYSIWYPGWTFALCCFDTTEMVNADPMLWWYEPKDPDHLFFPGLDCHTGAVPDLRDQVDVDHFIAVSSDSHKWFHFTTSWLRVPHYTEQRGGKNRSVEAKSLLPNEILANVYDGKMPQGDFIFDVAKVREGIDERAQRQLPPGAASFRR